MSSRLMIIATVLAAGAVMTIAGCLAAGDGRENVATADETPSQSDSAVAAENPRVLIDNFTFQPATLTVSPGTKVTWVNRDDVPHTATSSTKPRVFDSGALDTDDTYSFVFSTPGEYGYFCAVHPHMTGKIIVK